MTRAEEKALKYYPDDMGTLEEVRHILRVGFVGGYKQAEKDILAIIESRISKIIGDAQPRPALRAELEDLIKDIKK